MRIIAGAIRNPIAIGVTVLLICLFGALSLKQLPLQLFPDIERPTISIFTNWRGASPEEVEAELLEPQEQVLQGLPGVEEVNGNANSGGSQVFLTFAIGTDMKSALVDVIGRMSRLPPLPRDVDRPFVQLGGDGGDSNQQPVVLLRAAAARHRGTDRTLSPLHRGRRQAAHRIGARRRAASRSRADRRTTCASRSIWRAPQRSASAFPTSPARPRARRMCPPASSTSAAGNTRCATPVATTPRTSAQLVLAWRDGQPVRLADVATVEMRPPDRSSSLIRTAIRRSACASCARRARTCSSTLEEVKKVVAELRDGPLKERGLGIEQSFDASLFIKRAVNLLIENLVVGALLALVCVWWFMRDTRATVLIASTIPVCLLATFCVLHLAGRSINVISLAGLAFAVGMVVEGAIVVSGNIIRLKEGGMPIDAGRARRHATGRAGAVRFDDDDDRRVPAGAVPEGRRRTDLRRPGADDFDRSRVLDRRRDHGRAGRGRPLARRALEELRLRRRLAATHRPGDRMDAHAQAAARLGRRVAGRAAAAVVAAAAEARLPAAGEARRDRRVLQLPAGHEPGDRRSRDRRQAASSACSRT